MRKKSNVFLPLAASALLIVATLSSCTSPFSPFSTGDGGLWGILRISSVSFSNIEGTNLSALSPSSLSSSSSVTASTTFPTMDQVEITHYRVELSDGPGDAPGQSVVVEAGPDGIFPEPLEFIDLVPGQWLVTIEAFLGDPGVAGLRILRGSQTVTITMGSVATPGPVVISPVDDPAGADGSWLLRLTWPLETDPDYPLTDVVTAVEYSVNGGSWVSAGAIDTDGTNRSVSIGGTRAPGGFGVDVRLVAGDKPSPYNVVAREWEQFYVFSNLTSSRSIALTASEFSYGGGSAITVVIDNPEDLGTFFSGAPESTVVAGTPFAINANVTGATAWQWRLDGEVQPGVTGESFTMAAPAAGEAGVVRLITLEVTVNGTVYSANHRVRILPAE